MDEIEFRYEDDDSGLGLNFEQYVLGTTNAVFDPEIIHLVNFSCDTQCSTNWDSGSGLCTPGTAGCFPDFQIIDHFNSETGRLTFSGDEWKV